MSKRGEKGGKGGADPSGSNAAGSVEPAVVLPDPAIAKARVGVNHWAERMEQCVRSMDHVQATLRLLAGRNDKHQRELQKLRIDAGFLASLKLDELKAHRESVISGIHSGGAAGTNDAGGGHGSAKQGGGAAQGKKASSGTTKGQRLASQGSISAAAGAASMGDPTQQSGPAGGEAVTLDEKKRQKLYQLILSIYKSNPVPIATPVISAASKRASQRSPASRSSPSPAAPQPQTWQAAGIIELASTGGGRPGVSSESDYGGAKPGAVASASSLAGSTTTCALSSLSTAGSRRVGVEGVFANGAAAAVAANTSASSSAMTAPLGIGEDLRRPKEVPPPIWDELMVIRSRRIAIEAHVEHTNAEVEGQLEKMALLQEQAMVARHGLNAAFTVYVKAGGLKEESPPQPTTGSRPGSRGASAKGRGLSVAAPSGKAGAR